MELIGIGLYTAPEAAKLTKIPTQNVRRWILGYQYKRRSGGKRRMPPVIRGDLGRIDDAIALSFLDLMEVRMIHAFRKYGLSWHSIRIAADRAREVFQSPHPFAMKRFRTDGKRVFADLFKDGSIKLLDLNRDHFVFSQMVEPSLFEGIEFEADLASRWFPAWAKRKVVLDPKRSFGQPILAREGIPTEILANAVRVEGSVDAAAKWYEVTESAVRAAVDFENQLVN